MTEHKDGLGGGWSGYFHKTLAENNDDHDQNAAHDHATKKQTATKTSYTCAICNGHEDICKCEGGATLLECKCGESITPNDGGACQRCYEMAIDHEMYGDQGPPHSDGTGGMGEPWQRAPELHRVFCNSEGRIVGTIATHDNECRDRIIACVNALARVADPAAYIAGLEKVAEAGEDEHGGKNNEPECLICTALRELEEVRDATA